MRAIRCFGIVLVCVAGLAVVPARAVAQKGPGCESVACTEGRRLLVSVPSSTSDGITVQAHRIYADTASMWAIGPQAISVVLIERYVGLGNGPGPGGGEYRHFDRVDCAKHSWGELGYRMYANGVGSGPFFSHSGRWFSWDVPNIGAPFPNARKARRALSRLCDWARKDGMFVTGGGN